MAGFYRVGVTGPSAHTGGYGSQGDFHIDSKFSHSLPLAQEIEDIEVDTTNERE